MNTKLTRQEIIDAVSQCGGTIPSFPDRGSWGQSSYRGNCSGYIQASLIWKYNVQKLAELFAGSGTGSDVARDMGIAYIGADLNPKPVRNNILVVDATKDDVPTEFLDADMLFMHPPYGKEINIPYAGSMYPDPTGTLRQRDLGQMQWDTFMKELNAVIMKYYAAMAPGARMSVLMGDVRRRGILHSMLCDIIKPGVMDQVLIKAQHNTVSGRNGNYGGFKGFYPIEHEYIMVIKKPGGYLISFQLPKKISVDIRDSVTATWRDVVNTALKELGGTADLSTLYNAVDNYKRTTVNPHWQAKIRQTLQMYPCFKSVKTGVWAIAA